MGIRAADGELSFFIPLGDDSRAGNEAGLCAEVRASTPLEAFERMFERYGLLEITSNMDKLSHVIICEQGSSQACSHCGDPMPTYRVTDDVLIWREGYCFSCDRRQVI